MVSAPDPPPVVAEATRTKEVAAVLAGVPVTPEKLKLDNMEVYSEFQSELNELLGLVRSER
eukprot:5510893-Pyramimonas_sp.AAC.1